MNSETLVLDKTSQAIKLDASRAPSCSAAGHALATACGARAPMGRHVTFEENGREQHAADSITQLAGLLWLQTRGLGCIQGGECRRREAGAEGEWRGARGGQIEWRALGQGAGPGSGGFYEGMTADRTLIPSLRHFNMSGR